MGAPTTDSDAIFATETLSSGAQIEYAAGTVLKIAIPCKAPEKEEEGDDYYQEGLVGTQKVYMKYSPDQQGGYTGAGYFKDNKTTQVYPKDDGGWKWYLDADCTNLDITLNGRFNYAPANIGININGEVKFADKNYKYDDLTNTYTLTTTNSSFVNTDLAENADERKVYIFLKPEFTDSVSIIDGKATFTDATITPKYTQMSSIHHVETVNEEGNYAYTKVDTTQDPEFMLNLTICCVSDTTITYNQKTAVSVQGTQTYKTDTTSTYNNTKVKHFGLTSVTLNGNNSAVTEQFTTGNAQVKYDNGAVVTMLNNQAFSFAGTQEFANKGTIKECDEETKVEAGQIIKSGYCNTSYNGEIDESTTIVAKSGTTITYNNASTVTYDKNAKSTITGKVVYPSDGNIQVTYEENSTAQYPQNAQLILGANTTIHPQNGFKFKLTNPNSGNKIKITISTKDIAGGGFGKISYDDGNGSVEVTTSHEFDSSATITVNNNNTKLTFNADADITIESEPDNNSIVYENVSNVTYYKQTEVTYTNTTVTQPSVYASGDNFNKSITYTFKSDATKSDATKSDATQTYSGICYPTIEGKVNVTDATIVKDSAQFSYLGEVVDTQDNGIKNNTSNSITIHGNSYVGGAVGKLTQTGTMQYVALQNVVIYTKGGYFVGGVVGSAEGVAVGKTTYENATNGEYSTGYSSPHNDYIYKLNIVSCSVQNVFINHPSADTDGNQYGSYVGGFAGDLSACYVYDSGVKGGLYINAGYTIGGFAGSIGGGGNQGWYTFVFLDKHTVGGNNQEKDVIFIDCYLKDVCNYNDTDEQAQLFSNTDNPNGNFLNSWTGYEGGTSVWDAVGSSFRQVFGGSQNANERNLSAIIGQNAVEDSYYSKNCTEITTSGKGVNVNESR